MNYQVLKDEVTNDPLGRSYSGMTDEVLTASLNAVDRTRTVPINSATILKWAATSSSGQDPRILKLEAGELSATKSIEAISKVALIVIKRGDVDFDLNKTDVKDLVDALVSGGVLSTQDRTALESKATENISRAKELGLPIVRPGEIQQVRA